jgi:hypothetical protein
MTLNLIYRTTDEVNWYFAQELAANAGLTPQLSFPKDPLPDSGKEAIVFDLDWLAWTADERERLVKELVCRAGHCPAAVHGYNLTEEQAANLRECGILVSRNLTPELFTLLAQRLEGDGPGNTVA